ncbi:hypothetical protein ODJ79_37280 [Actinoplanes sp. KI2]|uniref:hypothetical protein n=1 Tax=Actinoplanes sp. KI2 TaxID=2983315 RepID=UPI0021D5EE91|nr:hypothetical protein [Actinoplanes sp. KI2]MCU7729402.1 hypothetical protein [Actinoplanes sp. KI2]
MTLIRRLNAGLAVTAMALTAAVSPAMSAVATPAAAPAISTGRLVQLRSLGGDSTAVVMNQRGDILGHSVDKAGNYRTVVWWHDRSTPAVVPVAEAFAGAISDNGHVAGRVSQTGKLFVWHPGTAVKYLRPPAGTNPEVTGLNDHDQVIGTTYYQNGTHRAFTWQGRHYRLLPVPKGANSTAVAINNRGQIIGTIVSHHGTTERAVLWQGTRTIRMTQLGTLGGTSSRPAAINDRGQIIGNSTLRKSSDEHPFLWQHGRMTDLLAHTKAVTGTVTAISDTGLMTGQVSWPDRSEHAVLWRGHQLVDLGLPGSSSYPRAVNDRGDVAGMNWSRPDTLGVPFRWRHGKITFFPKPVGDISTRVVGIDPHGTIVVSEETSYYGQIVLRSA